MIEAIVIKNYNKFRYKLDEIDFTMPEQVFRNGYWNVKKYSEQLEAFLKQHDIEHELVEDVYERFNGR